MFRRIRLALFTAAVGGAAVIGIVGCSNPVDSSSTAPSQATTSAPKATPGAGGQHQEDHGHKPSAHGGILVSIGSDSYHAEAVFEKGGVLRLYTLGKDESKVLEVQSQPLTAYVKPEGGAESESVVLQPKPQPGDKEGMTSLFVGQLPKELWGKSVEVTIPSIQIGGERFRLSFKSVTASEAHGGMPTKVADEEERKLYLTAGGKYTESDIKANGNVTASQKFKGLKAEHDLKPKPGDKICPVTLTKASPKFSWVIGGKTYEFCCPPCVDELVALAKEKPDELRDPSEYVKK